MLSDRYWSQAVLGAGPIQQRRQSYAVLPLATEVVVTNPVLKQNYQSFQLSARKRLSRGLEFTSAYTWSHVMSDNAGFYGSPIGNQCRKRCAARSGHQQRRFLAAEADPGGRIEAL